MLKEIRAQNRAIQKQIAALIEAHPRLKLEAALITSLPVLAQNSAALVLAEMPLVEDAPDAKSWAAAAGGHSTTRESGSSIRGAGKMSRAGRKGVRSSLWMCALNARATMPEIGSLYARLRDKGRSHKQALVACVRKLLMILYGVLKHKQPYKPKATLQAT
jgi:transposase